MDGPDEFYPTVNKLLHLGFSIHLAHSTHPKTGKVSALVPQDWRKNARPLIRDQITSNVLRGVCIPPNIRVHGLLGKDVLYLLPFPASTEILAHRPVF